MHAPSLLTFISLLTILPVTLSTPILRTDRNLVLQNSPQSPNQQAARKVFAKFTPTTNWRDVLAESAEEDEKKVERARQRVPVPKKKKKVRLASKEDFKEVARVALGEDNAAKKVINNQNQKSGSVPPVEEDEEKDPVRRILKKQQRMSGELEHLELQKSRERGMAEEGFFNGGYTRRSKSGKRMGSRRPNSEDEEED